PFQTSAAFFDDLVPIPVQAQPPDDRRQRERLNYEGKQNDRKREDDNQASAGERSAGGGDQRNRHGGGERVGAAPPGIGNDPQAFPRRHRIPFADRRHQQARQIRRGINPHNAR